MARKQNLARTHASQETALNHPIGADARHAASDAAAAPNGSARGYHKLFVPLATPAMALQVDGLAVCLCIASSAPDVLICRQ
jgi:hypothetical protein